MLQTLHISNIVLIESLTLDFNVGLCALTGETGAGKSILLDSLGLAMGARSEARLVRKGAQHASVTACFSIEEKESLKTRMIEQGLEFSDELIIRRIVNADGKSKAWINDQPVSIAFLKDIGTYLVEYHGQFETHGLRDSDRHGWLVDSYAELTRDLNALEGLWRAWRTAEKTLKQAIQKAQDAQEEEAYLRGCLEDLEKLAPEEGEEDTLIDLRQRLKNKEAITEALKNAQKNLISDKGAENALLQTTRTLDRAQDKIGESVETMISHLDVALEQVRDVTSMIDGLMSDFQDEEISQDVLDDRLYALRSEARKHNCLVDELSQKRADIQDTITMIEQQDDVLSALQKDVLETKKLYVSKAELIREKRLESARKLDKCVQEELRPLKLEKARFITDIALLDEAQWSAQGMDHIQFLVATNQGADPAPLGKIASGGEMARFMLALKVALCEVGDAQTLVFDEVDSGMGGATANAVGERLARLSAHKQILVVTHSPQVAAKASSHWIVSKGGDKEVTTHVSPLTHNSARQEEIARMLAGATITDEARAAADKLLEDKVA